uniref:VWFC domain-containing protein n=1 Tax=Taeniopygia guttata TaxID=59729 RepID=H0Z7M8_TAEGU
MSSPHPMGIAPSASAWLGMSPASSQNAPQDPASAPLRLTAAPAIQKSAISGAAHMRTEPGSAWMGTTAPPVSAREERWNVPSLPAPCWIVPSTSGTWVPGSAAPPAGTLQPLPVASWMTTVWSFPLDRSGLRAIPADGSVSCQRTDCVETCPYPIRIPGQCCPDCSAGCTYMGRIFSNNETFPSALDPCLSCICLLGSVACSPLECAIVCSYPFHPEGRCCPICEDCNYQGRKVENGQSFIPEGQPCTRCTCQLGEVSCEERPCPRSCSEPHTLPVGCCPSCPATDIRLLLQGSDLSPSSSPSSSQSSSQSPSSPPFSSQSPAPEDSPPGTPQHRRYRLAQLLLPTTLPLGPSPGIWGAGKPPLTTPSPSGYPLAPAVSPNPLCEATAPPDPTGSPEVQGSPGNEDPSAVPSDSPGFQVPGVPGTP